MARIPFVDPDDPDTDPHAAAYLRGVHDVQGVTLNVHRALANHPVLMEKIFEMGEVAYFNNGLDPVARELAYYTSAVANECHY